MGRTVVLGIVVAVLSAVALEAEGMMGYGQPQECEKSYECAPYQVIHSQPEFEIRSYTKAKWMATMPIHSSSYAYASRTGFAYLFAYIQGENAKEEKIEMTAPVFVNVTPSTGPFCNSTFVVHFYLPSKYQSDPPASDNVHPVVLPTKRYAAVRRFGGFMHDNTIVSEAAALSKGVEGSRWGPDVAASQEASGNAYTVAGYNSPYEYTGRVNEVIFWF